MWILLTPTYTAEQGSMRNEVMKQAVTEQTSNWRAATQEYSGNKWYWDKTMLDVGVMVHIKIWQPQLWSDTVIITCMRMLMSRLKQKSCF